MAGYRYARCWRQSAGSQKVQTCQSPPTIYLREVRSTALPRVASILTCLMQNQLATTADQLNWDLLLLASTMACYMQQVSQRFSTRNPRPVTLPTGLTAQTAERLFRVGPQAPRLGGRIVPDRRALGRKPKLPSQPPKTYGIINSLHDTYQSETSPT